jgi:O-antigen/teichoic acid export membrane protein
LGVSTTTPIEDDQGRGMLAGLPAVLRNRVRLLRDYSAAISGSAGRLVFSLTYFVVLANTLSIAEFGLFATASATGVMLSRILAFGYITALYRTATVRPSLIGVYSAGFIVMAIASLPVLGVASLGAHAIFFRGELALSVFLTVIAAEALLWRPVEAVVIVNNGMGRFGRAAILVILGTVLRAAAAGVLVFMPVRDLATWSLLYLAANAISLAVGAGIFYPAVRLRLKPRLYLRRLPDSLYVAGAEILFYMQMEMDKLLVLALGGPHLAGIYAMIMRLVDLTAIPIRTFTMMLVQRLMRAPELLARTIRRIGLEAAVFAVSTVALTILAVILHVFPTLLGRNVAEAAPLLGLALFVPGLRNLVEYQAELLFARGQTLLRAINLALLAGFKAVLLGLVLVRGLEVWELVLVLNGVFALLYVASALLTYSAMRLPAKAG